MSFAGLDIEREILDDVLPLPFLAIGFADALDLHAGLRSVPPARPGAGTGGSIRLACACIEGTCRAGQNKLRQGMTRLPIMRMMLLERYPAMPIEIMPTTIWGMEPPM